MSIKSLCGSGTQTVADNAVWAAPPVSGGQAAPRLLYLATTRSQGGIERHSVALAAALNRGGLSVEFACPPDSYLERWCREQGVSPLPFQLRNSGDLGAAFRLAHLLHSRRIDIIHAHSRRDYVTAVLGAALARTIWGRNAALVLHAHMIRPLGRPARLSGRFFEWGADAIAGVSAAVCETVRDSHQFPPDFVHLIPNGVGLHEYARPGSEEARQGRAQTRRLWELPEETLAVGMIGRLDAKGQKFLLAAAPALLTQQPGICFVLIGSEGRAGEQARLEAMAEAGGFRDRLIFTGPRDDIPRLLPALDLAVHLPADESFGLALAEAMAAGLPTVATNIGGCRELVRDEITGLLVTPGDVPALTDALRLLLTAEGAGLRRAEMGRQGRGRVAQDFSQERQTQRVLSLYRQLCPASGLPAPQAV